MAPQEVPVRYRRLRGLGGGGRRGGSGGFGEGGVLEGRCEHYQKALIEKVT